MTNQNNAAQPVLTDDEIRSIWIEHGLDDEAVEDFARAIETALLSKLRAPVADESPMAKMADALREKARQEQQAYQDRRNQATEWGLMPEGTEADHPTPMAPVAHVAGDETSRYLQWAKDRSAWEMPVGTPVYYSALASAPVAGEADQDEMERRGWVNVGYKHDLEKARRAISYCNIPGFDTMSLDNAIYWLRARADDAAPQASKPDFSDAYEGAREDLAIWKRRALEAENLLRIERETSCRLVAELNATNGPAHMGEPAPQASEAVRDQALEDAAQAAYTALFPTNDRSDWTEFAESAAYSAKWAAQCIRALKSQSAALSAQPGAHYHLDTHSTEPDNGGPVIKPGGM